jgi:hypothetical protein
MVAPQTDKMDLLEDRFLHRRQAMKDRRPPRKPATKFPNLRKKLAKNKVLGKQVKKK